MPNGAASPTLWVMFVCLFLVAGAMNLGRALRDSGAKRTARYCLAAACLLFAAASACFRFVNDTAGYILAGMAALLVVGSGLLQMGRGED